MATIIIDLPESLLSSKIISTYSRYFHCDENDVILREISNTMMGATEFTMLPQIMMRIFAESNQIERLVNKIALPALFEKLPIHRDPSTGSIDRTHPNSKRNKALCLASTSKTTEVGKFQVAHRKDILSLINRKEALRLVLHSRICDTYLIGMFLSQKSVQYGQIK